MADVGWGEMTGRTKLCECKLVGNDVLVAILVSLCEGDAEENEAEVLLHGGAYELG